MHEFTSAHLGRHRHHGVKHCAKETFGMQRAYFCPHLKKTSFKAHFERTSAPRISQLPFVPQGIIFFTVKLGILQPHLMCTSD